MNGFYLHLRYEEEMYTGYYISNEQTDFEYLLSKIISHYYDFKLSSRWTQYVVHYKSICVNV